MCPSMIRGWSMGLQWQCSPGGIRIRDFTWMAREWVSDSGSELGYLAASAGAGTIGDTIGTTTGESSTTTTRTSRTAGPLSTATVFIRVDRTSTMGPAELLAGMKDFMEPPART